MSLISYNLFKLLIEKEIKKTELAKMAGISKTTLVKFSKNQYDLMDVLVKICDNIHWSFDAVVQKEKNENNSNGGDSLEE